MRNILLVFCALYISCESMAQELVAERMTILEKDSTAIKHERLDNNDERCALVMVELTLPDVAFSGSLIGKVPYRNGIYWVYLAKGTKRLKMAASGYLPLTVEFSDWGINYVQSGHTYKLSIRLPEKKDRSGDSSLKILSIPTLGNVYIDGKEVGKTPLYLPNYETGLHKIKICMDGYVDYITSLTLYKGYAEEIEAEMQKLMPVKLICSIPEAELWVDDDPVGIASDIEELAVGSHNICYKHEGFKNYIGNVEVTEDGDSVFTQQMRKIVSCMDIDINMVAVDGGTYILGNDEATISSFLISDVEVTQELWNSLMIDNPSKQKGDKFPVTNVSWEDCQNFIKKLNEATNMTFRLPTEAEWEFAARGGNVSEEYKYCGSDSLDEVGWFLGNSDKELHKVATKKSNELSLYDMSGNVCEWCQDWFDDYPQEDRTDPTGPESGLGRVYRGGSRMDETRYCTPEFRYCNAPDFRSSTLGFRLAMDMQSLKTAVND